MKPYYEDKWVTHYCSGALEILPELKDESIDLLATDPPYGIGFMGKDWDKALPDKRIWQECLRVLKPGAFAFVMSIPRADCLSRMIISLEDAGFQVNFTPIFWAFASGFPKAQNIGKAVDKRLGAEREVVGKNPNVPKRHNTGSGSLGWNESPQDYNDDSITVSATPQAKALDGSYGGFQPKPAVEVIIVAMKPLSEKTFVDQALKNRKGITWLDDGRIPYESEYDKSQATPQGRCTGQVYDSMLGRERKEFDRPERKGRFPANLLVSDDVLNDGKIQKSGIAVNRNRGKRKPSIVNYANHNGIDIGYGDSGSFSRYFDLDKWAQKTFPFLVVSKASKSEKNKGLDIAKVGGEAGEITARGNTNPVCLKCGGSKYDRGKGICECAEPKWIALNKSTRNTHPTVKPLKLMSYLIALGSRPGDTVLDPFMGSGTTALASKLLGRKCIGTEIEEKYCEITAKRCSQEVMELKL